MAEIGKPIRRIRVEPERVEPRREPRPEPRPERRPAEPGPKPEPVSPGK